MSQSEQSEVANPTRHIPPDGRDRARVPRSRPTSRNRTVWLWSNAFQTSEMNDAILSLQQAVREHLHELSPAGGDLLSLFVVRTGARRSFSHTESMKPQRGNSLSWTNSIFGAPVFQAPPGPLV